MIGLSGGRVTVPQIFFDDDHIGGYDDLTRLIEKKDLIGILEDEKIDVACFQLCSSESVEKYSHDHRMFDSIEKIGLGMST